MVKYLDTALDNKLTWPYHFQMVTKKHSIAVEILSNTIYLKLFLIKFIVVLPTHTCYIQSLIGEMQPKHTSKKLKFYKNA